MGCTRDSLTVSPHAVGIASTWSPITYLLYRLGGWVGIAGTRYVPLSFMPKSWYLSSAVARGRCHAAREKSLHRLEPPLFQNTLSFACCHMRKLVLGRSVTQNQLIMDQEVLIIKTERYSRIISHQNGLCSYQIPPLTEHSLSLKSRSLPR